MGKALVHSAPFSVQDTNRPNTMKTTMVSSPSKKIYKPNNPREQKDFRPNPMSAGDRSQRFAKKKKETTKNGLELQCFFKTKICPFLLAGHCSKGAKCTYAHSQKDLHDEPNLKKTKICQQHILGRCNMGNRCSYAHGEHELRFTPEFYKTTLCTAFIKGQCKLGDKCRFAHGPEQLRESVQFESNRLREVQPTIPFGGDSGLNPENLEMNPMAGPNGQTDDATSCNQTVLQSAINADHNPMTGYTGPIQDYAFNQIKNNPIFNQKREA